MIIINTLFGNKIKQVPIPCFNKGSFMDFLILCQSLSTIDMHIKKLLPIIQIVQIVQYIQIIELKFDTDTTFTR